MKKEENQKVSEDAPKLGLETVTENVTDSKVKTEQEAKAKAEQDAKEKAEQEAKAKAEQEVKEKAEQEANNSKVWIRAILPLAGKFFMSHDPGHEFQHDKNQSEVIVESGYAEYLTPEEIDAK
ncbi:hypothetical protein B0A75_04695 [Flavobacterium oncorhynchi]|uniref:Uncharacterized protein n=1 Tax=Flavobacterium oncorhynchi TaxID=728056 RepID=A0A226I6C5_9FLAO|nr:hypothetical protein [Flavobacterium oncorhynchi]OXB01743.1 hypothetical protein B0A75_04695 [Flavobacterium oncorhynchi]